MVVCSGAGKQREIADCIPSGHELVSSHQLSRLWAGYGHIYRLHLRDQDGKSFTKILKIIAPPKPRDANDEGHLRKLLSYRVEANFYHHYAPHLPCNVPHVHPNPSQDAQPDTIVLLLDDLTHEFPAFTENRGILDHGQVDLAIIWLAQFHASHWNIESRCDTSVWYPPPLLASRESWKGKGLWQQGGYSYLATRMEELHNIDETWSRRGLNAEHPLAKAVDWKLNNPPDRTRLGLIHGDVKAANMAFGKDKMAMYDFQYVGKGLGVQDLAKFFTTSIPEELLEDEEGLLRKYHTHLLQILGYANVTVNYPFEEMKHDWNLALVSWVRFLAGWSGGFWGNTEWLEAKVMGLLEDKKWVEGVVKDWRERKVQT